MNDSTILLQNIPSFWPIILSLVFVIIWLVRLEAKVLFLDRSHEEFMKNNKEMEKEIREKLDEIKESVGKISESLARFEGRFEGKTDV